jgi:hypothetical protein
MQRIIVETPYRSIDPSEQQENIIYARKCMKDSIRRGESPFASHLLYTQDGVLDDAIKDDRARGIEMNFNWLLKADLVAVYIDRGVSTGMIKAMQVALMHHIPIEIRTFKPNAL